MGRYRNRHGGIEKRRGLGRAWVSCLGSGVGISSFRFVLKGLCSGSFFFQVRQIFADLKRACTIFACFECYGVNELYDF